MRLTTTFSNGDTRWSIFKELSDMRQRMSRLGTCPARLYDAHFGRSEERCRELLDGILAHFRAPSLSLASDAGGAHDSHRFVADILNRLKSASTWEASVERTRPFQFATMQEDVLLQELDEWIAHSPDHSDTYFEVRQWICLLRARDCAVSTYEQVWKPLLGKNRRHGVVASIGCGLAQFETWLTRQLGIQVLAADVQPVPELLAHPPELRCTTSHVDQTLTRLTAKRVDILILKDVLHHFETPARAVRQLARHLTDQGVLLVIEPYYGLGDGESCDAIRELDNTSFKHNLLAACEWEHLFAATGLAVLDRKRVSPGVIDNNDGFPRIAWLLGRRHSKGRA